MITYKAVALAILCLLISSVQSMQNVVCTYDLSDNPARGDTQLHVCIQRGTEEGRVAASKLLEYGFDVDHTSCMLGHTALHIATSSLDPLGTQLLLEQGALPQNTVNGLSALHLAVWTAIGTPIVAEKSVQAMLLGMRSKQVVTLSDEEIDAQARQVITLLLTQISKNVTDKHAEEKSLDDVVAVRIENARTLCNQKFYKTNQSASEMAAQSGDQRLADLCNPEKLHENYKKIIEASVK